MVDHLCGKLPNGQLQLVCPKQCLKVKGKAVRLTAREDLSCRLSRKGLTATLGIRKTESTHQGEHAQIGLGHELAQKGIALVAVLMQVARADHHLHFPSAIQKNLIHLLDHVGAVRQIGVGKETNVSRGLKHRRANGTALAAVLRIADHADVRKCERFNGLVTAIGASVTAKQDLVIRKMRLHIRRKRLGRLRDHAVLVIHRNANGNFHVSFPSLCFDTKTDRNPARSQASRADPALRDRKQTYASSTASSKRAPEYAPVRAR